jgi:hypothetical protein
MATRRTRSPAVVTLPLILLAIPSVCAGWVIGTFLTANIRRMRFISRPGTR